MDILSSFLLFIASVSICAIAGAVTKRKGIELNRIGLIAFHVLYLVGLFSAMILL